MAALVTDLNARLAADCGYQPDRRPFRAHITLARKVRAARPIVAVEAIAWPVTCFSLVESLSEPGGARYEVLASWPLTETPVL
jgi:2'-5' RNA ligase